MLDKCVRDQWSIDDLDWSLPPPHLPRDKEEAVVQAFTDMAGIELLAGALFKVQRDKTKDPTLKKIFSTFVADEKRHSAVASRLADHYNVHEYREYRREVIAAEQEAGGPTPAPPEGPTPAPEAG